jgi:hypothetical protein
MVELFLVFNGQFARYRRFGVFGLHGHFDLVAICLGFRVTWVFPTLGFRV